MNGRTSGTTTQTDTSSQLNPGKSQGRPNEKAGLEAHRPITAYPSAFSQQSPCAGSPDPKAGTGQSLRHAVSCHEMEQPWRRAVPAGARRLVFVRTSSRKRCDKALAVCRVRRKQHSGDLFPNARKSRNYGASDYLAMTTHVRSLSNAASAKGALGLPCYAATLACRRVMAASWRLRARHTRRFIPRAARAT